MTSCNREHSQCDVGLNILEDIFAEFFFSKKSRENFLYDSERRTHFEIVFHKTNT
jgi:hypothetical protein